MPWLGWRRLTTTRSGSWPARWTRGVIATGWCGGTAHRSLHALVGFATQPRVLLWFLRTRAARYLRAIVGTIGGTEAPGGDGDDDGPLMAVGVLAHLAVLPAARDLGLGSRLTREFVAATGARGSTDLRLVTLVDGGAADFYHRLGWERLGRRTRDGRTLQELRRTPV